MATRAGSRLIDVDLDESIGRSTPDVEHERAVAIFDLIEENSFAAGQRHRRGPYRLNCRWPSSGWSSPSRARTASRSPPTSCR